MDALEHDIYFENFEEFCTRVKETIMYVEKLLIVKQIIALMVTKYRPGH